MKKSIILASLLATVLFANCTSHTEETPVTPVTPVDSSVVDTTKAPVADTLVDSLAVKEVKEVVKK